MTDHAIATITTRRPEGGYGRVPQQRKLQVVDVGAGFVRLDIIPKAEAVLLDREMIAELTKALVDHLARTPPCSR